MCLRHFQYGIGNNITFIRSRHINVRLKDFRLASYKLEHQACKSSARHVVLSRVRGTWFGNLVSSGNAESAEFVCFDRGGDDEVVAG